MDYLGGHLTWVAFAGAPAAGPAQCPVQPMAITQQPSLLTVHILIT